jgi:hypothetical protein
VLVLVAEAAAVAAVVSLALTKSKQANLKA